MNRRDYEARVLEMLGDAKTADQEMRAFRKDARILSSSSQNLIKQYPNRWIGIHRGKVVAQGATIDFVVQELEALGVRRGDAIVRYISKNPRKMFL